MVIFDLLSMSIMVILWERSMELYEFDEIEERVILVGVQGQTEDDTEESL